MITAATLGAALLWSAIAAAATWFALYPVRRRHLTGVLASVVLTGTAASIGALLGGMHEMLLPMHHWPTVLALTVAAGAIATVAAGLAARRLTHDNRVLRQAISDLAVGRVPEQTGRPLTAELQALRSELADTAATLAETRERERALESARRELVSWVSHDLRTPLAGLRAMSEALEDGVVDDPHLYYKQIAASADRLSDMVDDLFELSRIQAGDFTRATEQIALDDLVSDCVAALTPLATAEGVTLSGHAQTSASLIGAVVLGNGTELNRALTNLIANAIRHTAAGGTVDVELTGSAHGVEVTVSDECGGIPQVDLARVFDVGFRGETARRQDRQARGGLGLAITKGIVEAHEGTIEVHNSPPGCTFQVHLPTRQGAAS